MKRLNFCVFSIAVGSVAAFSCGVSDRIVNIGMGGGGSSGTAAAGAPDLGGAGAGGSDVSAAAGTPGEAGAPGCTSTADCNGGACLPNGQCAPPPLELTGHIQHYEILGAAYQSSVTVTATDVNPLSPPTSSPSATDGSYTLPGLPHGAYVNFELNWDQTASVFLPQPVRKTRLATDTLGTDATRTLDLPVVSFNWLAQTAVDCGIFSSLTEATTVSGNINPFWTQRSTVLVEVDDASGKPLSGVTAQDIEIVLGAQSNTNLATDDGNAHPAQVCFLKAASGGSLLAGSTQTATDATGRFVMFRVRNDTDGTGFGVADVRVNGIPDRVVTFRSSGQIGVVQVGAGLGFIPQPPRARDFETDIYPLFGKLTCNGCHVPLVPGDKGMPDVPGPGYDKSIPRGPNKLKADYSGTPDQVYAVLTATNGGDCSTPQTLERICVNDPTNSLLAHMPFVDPPGQEDHPTAIFYSTDDPDYQSIIQWIQQGAKR